MDEQTSVGHDGRDGGGSSPVVRLGAILACASAPSVHERLHEIEHVGGVEYVLLSHRDMARRRLRVTTDKGTCCAIALPRGERLYDGAVLALGESSAIVVRVAGHSWLRLRPASAADAMRLGYHAGNLHWRVRFDGEELLVAMEGSEADYRARLREFTREGRVVVVGVTRM